jgi:hypothetical protein
MRTLLVVLPCCSFTLAGWQCIRTVVVSRSNSNTTTYSKYIVFKDFMLLKKRGSLQNSCFTSELASYTIPNYKHNRNQQPAMAACLFA